MKRVKIKTEQKKMLNKKNSKKKSKVIIGKGHKSYFWN